MWRILSTVAVALLTTMLVLAQQSAPLMPGKLVDVGGIRLHINCTGPNRGPTVILIAGIGDYSFDWSLVQQRVETSSQVCSYDRAGLAWSEKDSAEPNLIHASQQLVNLLRAAQVSPPYIFVGHSWGGGIARVATSLIPQDAAGMVLVDSIHEDEILGITVGNNDTAVRPRKLSAADWDKIWNPSRPVAPGGPSSGPPSGTMTMKPKAPSIKPPFTHLPDQAQAYRLWALSRPRPIDGGDFRSDLTTLFESRGGKDHPLGDLPLIVVTPTGVQYDAEPGFTPEQLREDHLRLQADLATLSRRGKQVFSKGSGHHVQLDDPTTVVTAIQDIIQQTQQTKRPNERRP